MLSDLEHVTLGIIHNEQPCTVYSIRKIFLNPPSSHWSGSAGAIYPLVRRLERRGLARSSVRRHDRRLTRLYRLTNRGRAALKTWLKPPWPPAPGLVNVDPLRIRVRFLDVLSNRERGVVVEEAIEKLRAHLKRVESEALRYKRAGDKYAYLIGRGAALSIKAQLAWLRELRGKL